MVGLFPEQYDYMQSRYIKLSRVTQKAMQELMDNDITYQNEKKAKEEAEKQVKQLLDSKKKSKQQA